MSKRKETDLKDNKISLAVKEYVNDYFVANSEKEKGQLVKMVMQQVEIPLYQTLLELSRYNQTRAAAIAGLTRATLRNRLNARFGISYFPKDPS